MWRLRMCALLCALAGCALGGTRLDEPTQAVVGPDGLIYVTDGYINARVAVFDQRGGLVRQWGSRGFARGQLHTPHGLAILPDGGVLVADRDNARLQLFSPEGALREVWSGEALGRPWSVATSPDGQRIFALDGGDQDEDAPRAGVLVMDARGQSRCRFGAHGRGAGELDWGHMIAASSSAVYAVDLRGERLVRFVQGDGPCGFVPDPAWPQPDAAPEAPLGVAAANGRVYVSQQGAGRPILVLDEQTGQRVGTLGEGRFERAHGLSVDADGAFWVTDVATHQIIKLDVAVDAELLRLGEER